MREVPDREGGGEYLTEDSRDSRARHAHFHRVDEDRVEDDVDQSPGERARHREARASVRADDRVHRLSEDIEWYPKRDPEEVFLRAPEGLVVDPSSESRDYGVREDEIGGGQHGAHRQAEDYRVRDALFGVLTAPGAEAYADIRAASVADKHGEGERDDYQRVNDCVRRVSV